MSEKNDLQIELTADIVCAYVSNNPVPVGELANVIADVYAALESHQAPNAQPNCLAAGRKERTHVDLAMIAGFTSHPAHQRIDIHVTKYLDQVRGKVVVAALAALAPNADQAPRLVQRRKRKDAVSVGGRDENELGTNTLPGQVWNLQWRGLGLRHF